MHIYSHRTARRDVRRYTAGLSPFTKMSTRYIILLSAMPVAAVLCASCNEATLAVSAQVVDTDGKPIPGALLYVEAYTGRGAYDFAWSRAAGDGRVPPGGGRLALAARPSARLAVMVTAPGHQTVVLLDHTGALVGHDVRIELAKQSEAGAVWEPGLAQLSYPFEDQAHLAKRLGAAQHAELRRGFAEAYAGLDAPQANPLARELDKKRRVDAAAGRVPDPPKE